MNWYQFFFFISLFGVFQGMLLSGIFFIKNQQQVLLSRLMGGLFLSGSLVMLLITLTNSKMVPDYTWLDTSEYLIGLLTGPLLWLTIRQIKGKSKKYLLIHFFPAFFFLVIQIIFPGKMRMPILLVMLHLQGYTLAAGFEYWSVSKNKLAGVLKKYYKWAGWLLGFYLFIGLSQWVRFSFAQYENLNLIIPMTASFHLYLVVMVGFNHSFLEKGWGKKNRKMAMLIPSINIAQQAILEQIEKDKLFLQEGLTISELAIRLGIPPHELSSLLNTTNPGGFALYINSLRVDYAKKILVDPQYHHLSMEGIGRESGFQSRSAFYQYFKQSCGMSPSLYQKKMSGISKQGQAQLD